MTAVRRQRSERANQRRIEASASPGERILAPPPPRAMLCTPTPKPAIEGHLRRRFGDELAVRGDLPATDPGVDVVVADSTCFGGAGEPLPSWLLDVGQVVVATDEDEVSGVDPLIHPIPRVGRVAKRAVDVVGAIVGLLVFSIPLALGALAVLVDSGFPVLHRGRRVGEGGRPFDALKLRTMHVDNDPSTHQAYVESLMKGTAAKHDGIYRLANDDRITRSGGPLRKFAIDELPQLWNVLNGDMSLVGPRPPMDREALVYDGVAWNRLRVRPGVTGLWQVEAHGEVSFDEMVELDNRYWRDWSFWRDIGLLLRTPLVVARARGFR